MRRHGLVALAALLLTACRFGGSDPPPAAGMYDPCDYAAECGGEADLCTDVHLQLMGAPVIGGVCTLACQSSDDCPEGGVCAAFDNRDQTFTTCQRPCESDTDCAEKYACSSRNTLDLGQVDLCVPTCPNPGPPNGC